ncbi:MAG TPA: AAA family ATPase [Ramlibacter sp.]
MRIKHVEIENFRLLRKVAIGLEERTTLIVGRNNSGKTSLRGERHQFVRFPKRRAG